MAKVAQRNPELKGDRCSQCNGTGKVIANLDKLYFETTCDSCRGTGLVNSPNACKTCRGSGVIVVKTGANLGFEANCGDCNGAGLKPLK